MKKVSDTEKRDRSAAAVPGTASSAPNGGASAPSAPPASGGGLADALAAALSQRNKKVSASGKIFHPYVVSLPFTADCCR